MCPLISVKPNIPLHLKVNLQVPLGLALKLHILLLSGNLILYQATDNVNMTRYLHVFTVCISYTKKTVQKKIIQFSSAHLACVWQYMKFLVLIITDFTVQNYMKHENCTLLGYYVAVCGNCLPTSVNNYHTPPRNIQEECSSHEHCGGNLNWRLYETHLYTVAACSSAHVLIAFGVWCSNL
jgi:hypothetical protein